MYEFVRNPAFPDSKTRITAQRKLWKLEVREWAFAEVDVKDVPEGLKPESNNPNASPGCFDKADRAIRWSQTQNADQTRRTVRFYAKAKGFTMIHLFRESAFKAEGDSLQVEVLDRRASGPDQISLATLGGKSVVVNALDAKAYTLSQSTTFQGTTISSIFDSIPSGADHVVISSHGGFLGSVGAERELCMFAAGTKNSSERLGVHNVTELFAKLKGKVSATCVVWLGGCNIGANNEFCQKAADASGCNVIAANNALENKSFPKDKIDLLDRYAGPKLFVPNGTKPEFVGELCAKQAQHKFTVPI